MNNFSKRDGNTIKTNLFMIMFFILMSNVAVFAQTDIENNSNATAALTENNVIVNNNIEIHSAKQEVASSSSNMNFVLWFMGSKQSPNATTVPAGTTAKKQFITSGTAPNRLLIRAFLKKAVNFESAMV